MCRCKFWNVRNCRTWQAGKCWLRAKSFSSRWFRAIWAISGQIGSELGAGWMKCCAVLFSHLGSLLAAWQHNVQAFTWIQMQLWHCVMITIYNLGGHEIVKLDTTIAQCYPVIHILSTFMHALASFNRSPTCWLLGVKLKKKLLNFRTNIASLPLSVTSSLLAQELHFAVYELDFTDCENKHAVQSCRAVSEVAGTHDGFSGYRTHETWAMF